MITAIFNPGDKSITTEKVRQWDYGQVLSIKGLDLPKAVEIHFCVYTDSTAIPAVGITTDDHTDVEIPDGLLRQDRELRAYVYVADMEQGKTVRTVNIPIQSRQKPEIPHTPEDTEIFREAIKAVNNSADRAETAANTSEQNAEKTAEDRKTIEEMVETVSGIEQQVQDVKKYAGQAETAASNAALSEQEAKEAKTAALQAKADAETAKVSAETAAGKTAEDRTTVERAKEEVLQAKQQVSTDRAAVEAVERKVAQMGNAIPQAVLEGVQAVGNAGVVEKQGIVQAGTEQKSAVESAGTKTIEDINLAKKTATDAVETAKTGAVGAIGTAGTEQTQNVTAEGEKQVKAVADKGNEVLQSIPEDFTTQMESKLDKQQGVENKGKALVVGEDGNVVVGEVTDDGGSTKIPQATEELLGGIKAKVRTTETLEVAIDDKTGKLYVQDKSKPIIISMKNWNDVSEIVKSGHAPGVFNIGDQFKEIWTDKVSGKSYEWVWDIVHMGQVTLEDGREVPGMYLQSHYLTPFAIQFDHEENERATEPTFSGDYSYYTKNSDGSYKLEEVVVGQQIPAEKEYYHSAIKDPTGNICRYGYNRWSHSAYRQWLNSNSAEKGTWWKAQHLGDVAPNELKNRAGFLSGFEQDFLDVIKKVKIRTQLNTITDKEIGTDEETVDLMFLPSKEQLYGTLEGSVYNDEAFEYYKQVAGFEAPNNGNSTGRIKYKLDAQTSADWQRLRSPNRGTSNFTWSCYAAGALYYNYAVNAGRCAPACVIA